MYCPSCGLFVQDDSLACSNCGEEMPIYDNYASGYSGTYNSNDYSTNYSSDFSNSSLNYVSAPQKTDRKLIIATLIGVVALLFTVVLCSSLINKSLNNKNGTYVCEYMKDLGINCTLIVDDDNFTLNISAYGESQTESGTIKFDGNKVELTVDSNTVEGEYDKSNKTITFSDMTFTLSKYK